MNTISFQKTKKNIKGIHLIYAIFFVITFLIRFFASQKLQINSYEASILLNLTGHLPEYPPGISLIQSMLIRASFFVFGAGDLPARIWPIILGSLLIFSPLYLSDQVGEKPALALSFLMTIDPLMIAHSIQVGSSIFAIFALSNMIGSIWKNKHFSAFIYLLLLLSSGRGLLFSILFFSTLCFLKHDFYLKVRECVHQLVDTWVNKIRKSRSVRLGGLVIAFIFLVGLFRIDLSTLLLDPINLLTSFYNEQLFIDNFFLYPIILFSYFPLMAFMTIPTFILYWKADKKILGFLLIWISIIFISLTFNNYLSSIDLIWISYPLMILSAFTSNAWIKYFNIHGRTENLALLIIIVFIISTLINFLSVVNNGPVGNNQLDFLFSFISAMIIVIILSVFFSLHFDIKRIIKLITVAACMVFLFIQVGISFRASGLAGSPYSELLWAGNIFDADLLKKQIKIQEQMKENSTDEIKISLLKYNAPGILWQLRSYDLQQINDSGFLKNNSDLIISGAILPEKLADVCYGQKLIENGYPDWINEPSKNIFYSDYWMWMTTRRSKISKSFYYTYVCAK